jgi:hypothetical protein
MTEHAIYSETVRVLNVSNAEYLDLNFENSGTLYCIERHI